MEALSALTTMDVAAKQPQAAMTRLNAALQQSPDNPQLLYLDAMLQMYMKNYPAAKAAAEKVVQANPSNEPALQLYSQALVATGGTDQAMTLWQNWFKSHPTDSRAALLLGTLEEAKGDTAKAQDYYKQALQIRPDDGAANNNLAFLMVESGGNADLALSYAQTARKQMPNSPNTADTLAWVYYHKATYSMARDLLEDASHQAPTDASIQYHLGATYAKLNDKTNALVHLKQAVSLAPDSRAGKEAAAIIAQLG